MHYNEQNPPLFTRNPLSNKLINTPTYLGSKKHSFNNKDSNKKIGTQPKHNKENDNYTFEPKTNYNGKSKRSIDKFVKDQQKFLIQKQQKIQQLRQQINKTQQDQIKQIPTIDAKSKIISSIQNQSRKNTSIFQRLSQQKIIPINISQQNLFSPKILQRSKSMNRNVNVSVLLYEDAKRRHEKQQIMAQSQRKQRQILTSPKINSNTNILVLKKIQSQFNSLVSQQNLNPLVALSVLQQIFNITLNPNKNSPQYQLVQNLMGLLIQNNSFGQIKTKKLWELIKIIIVGQIHAIYFTHEQISIIIQKYQYFYKERVRKQKKSISPQKPTFRPKTLSNSSKLANSYRQKTCNKIQNFIQNQKINLQLKDGNYTIQDLFIIDHMQRQSINNKKKQQKQKKIMQQCTFKPNIQQSLQSHQNIKKKTKVTLKSNNKNHTLKTQYTNVSQIEDKQIVQNRPSRSRQQKQKHRRQKQNRITNLSDNIKDVQKVIMRMSVGRQKRQFSNKLIERGYPKDQNWTLYRQQMHRKSVQNSKRLKGYGNQ